MTWWTLEGAELLIMGTSAPLWLVLNAHGGQKIHLTTAHSVQGIQSLDLSSYFYTVPVEVLSSCIIVTLSLLALTLPGNTFTCSSNTEMPMQCPFRLIKSLTLEMTSCWKASNLKSECHSEMMQLLLDASTPRALTPTLWAAEWLSVELPNPPTRPQVNTHTSDITGGDLHF